MPELPEVETVKNELGPVVTGHRISGITLLWEGIVKKLPAAEFTARVTGQRIEGLARRGKYLLFRLQSGETLVMHLKMSGSLLVNYPDGKYVRARVLLDDGTEVSFRDPRKFGAMWLAENGGGLDRKLGPEPLEKSFTSAVLAERLRNRVAPIKPVLIDQSVIAGIGNMYADEALYDAGIHPLRPAGSLSPEEIKRLHHSIKRVLRLAIGNKGASVVNYYRPGGDTGTAHFEFKVAHGRQKKCPICGTPIQRIAIRNRGTYFCPKCQK